MSSYLVVPSVGEGWDNAHGKAHSLFSLDSRDFKICKIYDVCFISILKKTFYLETCLVPNKLVPWLDLGCALWPDMSHMAAARGALVCLWLGHVELHPPNSATGLQGGGLANPNLFIYFIYDADTNRKCKYFHSGVVFIGDFIPCVVSKVISYKCTKDFEIMKTQSVYICTSGWCRRRRFCKS